MVPAPQPAAEPGPEIARQLERVPPVSVVILTLNEEVNIAGCLASCTWCDDVHVLDSGSEDRTVEIARDRGAKVHVHPFTSFGEQRNWAIDHIDTKFNWIFHLDADERFTADIVEAMQARLASDPVESGFHIPHKVMFMDNWLKHSAGYPTYQMRLFHKKRTRFCDYGHGQREETNGQTGVIDVPYLHFSFSKGLYDWLDKHNRYSSLEALQIASGTTSPWALKDLLFADRIQRWRAWKEFIYHLPFRSSLRWFATLFINGGILEGRAGLTYARLICMYEKMITLKLRLLRAHSEFGGVTFEADSRPNARTSVFDAHDRVDKTLPAPADRPAIHAVRRFEQSIHEVPTLDPEPSPWSFREKLGRTIWMVLGKPIFRLSFHNWYGFRAWILRVFGGKVGRNVTIRPTANIEIPWMLEIDDDATIGDYAIIYSLGQVQIGKRSIVSQYAHLCAGTHDYTDRHFRLVRAPIRVGDDVWVGADVFIGPNVHVGSLAVVGARSSVYKNLAAKQVHVGNPARPIKERMLR